MVSFGAFIVTGIVGSLLSVDFQRRTTAAVCWVALFGFSGLVAAGIGYGRGLQLYERLWFEQWAAFGGGGLYVGGMAYMFAVNRYR